MLFSFLLIFFVLGVAFIVLVERYFLSLVQLRVGPRVVGFLRIMQTILDRRKLFSKKFFRFLFRGFLIFFLNFCSVYVDLYFLLFILRLSSSILILISFLNFNSLSFYSVFRGNIVSISFDILFAFLVIFLLFSIFSFTITLFFFLLALIECRRTPYDLNERESELVSGYNIEYSGLRFTFLFLREYLGLIVLNLCLFLFGFQFFVFCALF